MTSSAQLADSTAREAGTDLPPARAGPPVRVVVCYDGCWYRHAVQYFSHARRARISPAGLHDAIRWHAAGLYGCPVQHVAIIQAHYITGRTGPDPAGDADLAGHGITVHDVPVTVKGEVGADVELALTCWQIACDISPDLIALLAGDGDFTPLAARLAARGIRVLVPRTNFSYPGPAGQETAVTTSSWLTSAATDIPALTDLLDDASGEHYPPGLARPYQLIPARPAPPAEPATRRRGTVARWAPGSTYGFLISDDGQTWYAESRHTPRHAPLTLGTRVTFNGHPASPPGRNYPPARAILVQPPPTTAPAAPS